MAVAEAVGEAAAVEKVAAVVVGKVAAVVVEKAEAEEFDVGEQAMEVEMETETAALMALDVEDRYVAVAPFVEVR